MLVPTTASGLPTTTYLTRSCGKISSESHLETIWWPWGIMVVRARWGGGGAEADSQHHGATRTEAVYKLIMLSPVYLHIIGSGVDIGLPTVVEKTIGSAAVPPPLPRALTTMMPLGHQMASKCDYELSLP